MSVAANVRNWKNFSPKEGMRCSVCLVTTRHKDWPINCKAKSMNAPNCRSSVKALWTIWTKLCNKLRANIAVCSIISRKWKRICAHVAPNSMWPSRSLTERTNPCNNKNWSASLRMLATGKLSALKYQRARIANSWPIRLWMMLNKPTMLGRHKPIDLRQPKGNNPMLWMNCYQCSNRNWNKEEEINRRLKRNCIATMSA